MFIQQQAMLKNFKIDGMSHNMKKYVTIVESKNVNTIVNLFGAPVNGEELFADKSDDGLKAPTRGNTKALIASYILARHFFLCVSVFIFEWCLFLLLVFLFSLRASVSLVFLVFQLCFDIMNGCFLLMFRYFYL